MYPKCIFNFISWLILCAVWLILKKNFKLFYSDLEIVQERQKSKHLVFHWLGELFSLPVTLRMKSILTEFCANCPNSEKYFEILEIDFFISVLASEMTLWFCVLFYTFIIFTLFYSSL